MKRTSIALATILLSATAALAQQTVVASTDLNVRSGPGPNYPVVGVIGADQQASVEGCVQGSKWCRVAFAGGSGWAYSDYLVGSFEGRDVVLTERASTVAVIDKPSNAGAATGAATGAIAGALIGGPIGAAVGGIAGGAIGAGADVAIDSSQRQYIVANPVDPVYLDGEVVVGAQVPNTVQLRTIPASNGGRELSYANVNGQYVLVESGTGRITYIVRN